MAPRSQQAAAVMLLFVLGCRCSGGSPPSPAEPAPTASAEPRAPMTESEPTGTLAPHAGPGDGIEARRARALLVHRIESFDKPWGDGERWDPRVLAALLKTPRHLFVPGVDVNTAYRDAPQPIGHGQTISQPTVVALMTQALALTGSEKVLEIGTGSGYQAAVLSHLATVVYTIEIVAPLGEAAQKRLADLGYANVHVRIGDGYRGWPEQAPFDRILLTAAPPSMPEALVDQLAVGGSIVAPVGELQQELVRWTKRRPGAALDKESLGAVRFVPMVPAD